MSQRYPIPLWVKMIAYVLQPLNPLWGIRIAGPMGIFFTLLHFFTISRPKGIQVEIYVLQ